MQAVELYGVRYVAEHSQQVADGKRREHVVAGGKHAAPGQNGDDEQATDDAQHADDDADVAVIASVFERETHQQTRPVRRLHFR